MKTRLRQFVMGLALIGVTTGFMPAKDTFSASEQQQISIPTPGLFSRSNAFSVDFSILKNSDYSFPLPVGKAEVVNQQDVKITTTQGDAVKAMFDGVVRLSRSVNRFGNVVVIRHNNGLETVYGHNAQNLVQVEQRVQAGQTIAIVGYDGVQAYTLFSIMVNGARINPETILEVKAHRLRKQTLLCKRVGNRISVSVSQPEPSNGGLQNIAAVGKGATGNTMCGDVNKDPFESSSTIRLNLASLSKMEWCYPLLGSKVISPYGGKRRHSGVDLKTKPNDNIHAVFDGVVTRSGPFSGYGNCVVIKHANGFETLYSHQSKNLVKTGQLVKAGDVIGLTGRTGRATTEHLHFEVHFKGRKINPAVVFDHANRSLQQCTLVLSKSGNVKSERNYYAEKK
uniref:M23ase beta-sheet core domain-containing protein n=1 Tax=Prevotella sp. GTC17253 TaxID=3236793 RepID=A0AB33IS96_9BACT